jgi:hypothetical protein
MVVGYSASRTLHSVWRLRLWERWIVSLVAMSVVLPVNK